VVDQITNASPDRLNADERLPEAETAFGLPIPKGMRLTRYFDDSAYFSGELDMRDALEQIRGQLLTSNVELMSRRAVFSRAYIKGDAARRLFRIEISATPQGSQVYVKNITPPAATAGLSESEAWKRAGRKPDGSLLDANQVY
jgi:hypothetical protein